MHEDSYMYIYQSELNSQSLRYRTWQVDGMFIRVNTPTHRDRWTLVNVAYYSAIY